MKPTTYLKFAVCVAASVVLVGCAGTRYSRSTGQYIDDKATAARVHSALHDDSLVKGADINVESFRGNVHLTGFVDHPAQKERASQLARNVKGVDWFKNDIVVKETLPGEASMNAEGQINEPAGASRTSSSYQQQNYQQRSAPAASSASGNQGWQKGALNVYDPAANISAQPAPVVRGNSSGVSSAPQHGATGLLQNEAAGGSNDLTRRVYSELRADNSIAAQNIQIQSGANGKIILRGTVATEDQKDSIENKVKAVSGVNDVDNQLEVQNK